MTMMMMLMLIMMLVMMMVMLLMMMMRMRMMMVMMMTMIMIMMMMVMMMIMVLMLIRATTTTTMMMLMLMIATMMMMVMMMLLMMMLMMLMMVTMMMVMVRGRWWCGCWGGGRWWSWGGWYWGGRQIPRPGSTLCASLRCRNAQRHCTRGILCGNFQGKCQTLIPAPAFCASLRSRNAHGLSQEGFCAEIYRKMPHASPTDIVLCELAQSKCTWTCHKRHFVRDFTRKTPDASNTTSIEHRALYNCYRKNPFSVATLFGEKPQINPTFSMVKEPKPIDSELCINSKSMITQNTQTAPTESQKNTTEYYGLVTTVCMNMMKWTILKAMKSAQTTVACSKFDNPWPFSIKKPLSLMDFNGWCLGSSGSKALSCWSPSSGRKHWHPGDGNEWLHETSVKLTATVLCVAQTVQALKQFAKTMIIHSLMENLWKYHQLTFRVYYCISSSEKKTCKQQTHFQRCKHKHFSHAPPRVLESIGTYSQLLPHHCH